MEKDKKALSLLVKKLVSLGKKGEEPLNILLDTHLQAFTFKHVWRSKLSLESISEFFQVPVEMVVLQGKRLCGEKYI
ncbi:MAG: hypothetical protein KAI72_01705 [Candidatus Pacebacteria bacterium]|nr:hypothetical protein [Candidatus Paceibacterota bacterium]